MIDPQSYVSGSVDRSWFNVVDELEIGPITTTSADGASAIGATSAGPLKMRLFAENLPGILDAAMVDPKFTLDNPDQVLAAATGLLNSIALDRLEIRGANQAPTTGGAGGRERRFENLTASGITATRVEEVALSGLVLRDDALVLTLDKLLLGRFTMPTPKRVTEAQKVMRAGGTVDTLALAPTIGLVKFEKLDYASGPVQFALGAGTFDLKYFVGAIPTNIRASLSNLRIPANSIQNPGLRNLLDDFRYQGIDASAELVAAWQDNTAEIAVERIRFRSPTPALSRCRAP